MNRQAGDSAAVKAVLENETFYRTVSHSQLLSADTARRPRKSNKRPMSRGTPLTAGSKACQSTVE